MARILSQEELRRRARAGLLGGETAHNPYPITAGPYAGPTEITPILEQGILDYKVIEEDPTKIPPAKRDWKTLESGSRGNTAYSAKEIRMRPGIEGFNSTLLHELRHGGLDYLRKNPDLMPYVMHYLQYDEGEFGRSLRDVLQRGSYDDVSMQTPEHKMLDAVDPRPSYRTGEIWEDPEELEAKGLLGPEISLSGFQSDEERAQYVQMMKEANEALAKSKKKKKKI